MNPAELFQLFSGLAEHPENFAVESQFINSSWIGIGAVQNLARSGRYADGPRRAWSLRPFDVLGRLIANGRARGVVIERNIDLHFAKEFTIAVEHLNPAVTPIADINSSLRIGGNAMRCIEFSGLIAALAHDFSQLPFLSTLAMRELM